MVQGMITRLSFNEAPTIAFGGTSFGKVGTYEKIQGRAFGELDPSNPLNAVITDIALAPRNARGMVEYAVDFYILRPADPTRGNRVMVFDVTNRGNKMTYLPLSFPFRGPGRYLPNNDPCGPDDAGTGLLMRQGNTIVWTGWDATAPPGGGRMTLTVPVAEIDGKPIIATALEEIMADMPQNPSPTAEMLNFPLTYPAASLDKSEATLTVRKYREDPPTVVSSDQWEYIDASTIALSPAGKKSFEPGMVYQFIYRAKNPKVIGIGFAAVRDFASFARYAASDANGTPNPLADTLQWSIATGLSQSGRFHRPFLYLGFNQDENGRQVFDGMMP